MQAIYQLINSATKTYYTSGGLQPVPLVFREPSGTPAGVAAQYSQCFAAWYEHFPGLKVVSPWNSEDAKGLIKSAIQKKKKNLPFRVSPVVVLEVNWYIKFLLNFPRSSGKRLSDPYRKSQTRKAGYTCNHSFSFKTCQPLLRSSAMLSKEGLEYELIHLQTIRPMDTETIETNVVKSRHLGRGLVTVGSRSWNLCQDDGGSWVQFPGCSYSLCHCHWYPCALCRF